MTKKLNRAQREDFLKCNICGTRFMHSEEMGILYKPACAHYLENKFLCLGVFDGKCFCCKQDMQKLTTNLWKPLCTCWDISEVEVEEVEAFK
jgi:hypothetical protein